MLRAVDSFSFLSHCHFSPGEFQGELREVDRSSLQQKGKNEPVRTTKAEDMKTKKLGSAFKMFSII